MTYIVHVVQRSVSGDSTTSLRSPSHPPIISPPPPPAPLSPGLPRVPHPLSLPPPSLPPPSPGSFRRCWSDPPSFPTSSSPAARMWQEKSTISTSPRASPPGITPATSTTAAWWPRSANAPSSRPPREAQGRRRTRTRRRRKRRRRKKRRRRRSHWRPLEWVVVFFILLLFSVLVFFVGEIFFILC